MDENEWLACDDPEALLRSVRGGASERQLRLFACACVRAAWPSTGEPDHPAVEAAERFADGQVGLVALLALRNAPWSPRTHGVRPDPTRAVAVRAAATATTSPAAWSAALNAADASARIAGAAPRRHRCGCDLLRDIIGNPFHPPPTVAHAVLAWNGGIILKLAQAAYGERHLPSGHLEPSRLAVLADALEEAGVADADLLQHLHGPGPHVRGCFALDLILGRR